jgi:uncharacterized delta-60 repeat protein
MKSKLIIASLIAAATLAACSSPIAPIAPEDLGVQPTLTELNADNDSSLELSGTTGGLGNLLIRKIYDTNQNGRHDDDEPGIPDWGVRIVSLDANGNPDDAADVQVTPWGSQRWRGVNLKVPYGRYKIEELEPTATKQAGVAWKVTGQASKIVNVSREKSVRAIEFAGVCLENGAVVKFPRITDFANWKCRAMFDLLPRIASFTATPAQIRTGGSSALAWNVLDYSSLEITPGVGAVSGFTDSKNVSPSSTTAYTLKATNGFGARTASVTVNVGSAVNPSGSPDVGFGSGGEVQTEGPVPGFVNPTLYVTPIVAQPDGRIIVGGSEKNGDSSRKVANFLLRYNANGSLDTSFGTAGRVIFGPIDADPDDFDVGLYFKKIILLPNGKILAFGTARDSDVFDPNRSKVHQLVVFRFNPTGTLDGSFGSGGRLSYDFNSRELLPFEILLQTDGKILTNSQFGTFVRYNPDGSFDTSFGNNGRVDKDPNADQGTLNAVGAMRLQSDGKILIASGLIVGSRPITPDAVSLIYDLVLRRYNPNGQIDTSFGNQGRLVVDLGSEKDSSFNLLLRKDGTLGNLGQNNFTATALRLPEDVVFSFGRSQTQSDGKIVSVVPNFEPRGVKVVRYNPDGRIDTGFATQGEAQLAVRGSVVVNNFFDAQMVLQSDGKILTVVWNGLSNNLFLYRLNP